MKNLNIENSQLAAEIKQIVENGNKISEKSPGGESINIYLLAWDKLPEPKKDWSMFSQWIAGSLFYDYIELQNFEKALFWAKISYECRESDIETSSLIFIGVAYYELNKLSDAIYWFDMAYKNGKNRSFQGFPKKYWIFYRDNIKNSTK